MAQRHVGAPRDGTMLGGGAMMARKYSGLRRLTEMRAGAKLYGVTPGGGADMVPFSSVVTAEDDAGIYTDVRDPLIRPVLVSMVKLYIVSVALEKHTESASWPETVLYTPVARVHGLPSNVAAELPELVKLGEYDAPRSAPDSDAIDSFTAEELNGIAKQASTL